MEFQVRQAAPSDAGAIVDLVRELAADMAEQSELIEDEAARFLAVPVCGVLLAESTGGVAGMLSYCIRPNLYHAGPVCSIDELIVHAAARRSGVGRALVTRLLALASEAGCRELSVSTMPDNAGAVRFYGALGFGDEALLLERHLP